MKILYVCGKCANEYEIEKDAICCYFNHERQPKIDEKYICEKCNCHFWSYDFYKKHEKVCKGETNG